MCTRRARRGGNQLGIFDGTTGALLATSSVTPAAPTATLPVPLRLTAGKSYVLGIKEAGGSPWSSAHALTALPSFLVIDDAAWITGSTLVYPSGRDGKPGQSNEDWAMSFSPAG